MDKPYFIDVLSVGQSKTLNADFDVASIAVDNPTGCWLLVEPLQRYIPPNRIGWRANLSPTAKTIVIRFVDAPTDGVTSVSVGGPVIITVSDYESDMDIGDDYRLVNATENLITALDNLSLGSSQAARAGYGTVYYTDTPTSGLPVLGTIIPAVPGKSIYIVSLMAQATVKINNFTYRTFGIPARLELWDDDFATNIFTVNSDGTPIRERFSPGSLYTPVGDGVGALFDATADAYAGIVADYTIFVEYYTE